MTKAIVRGDWLTLCTLPTSGFRLFPHPCDYWHDDITTVVDCLFIAWDVHTSWMFTATVRRPQQKKNQPRTCIFFGTSAAWAPSFTSFLLFFSLLSASKVSDSWQTEAQHLFPRRAHTDVCSWFRCVSRNCDESFWRLRRHWCTEGKGEVRRVSRLYMWTQPRMTCYSLS